MGVACGWVAPLACQVRSEGLAVMGCGSGLICVGALAGLGGFDGCRLGFGAAGRSGARWRARRAHHPTKHHTGAPIFGASSHGKLRTLADAVTALPPPATIRPCNIW